MKKIISLFVASAIAGVMMVGCSQPAEGTNNTPAEAPKTEAPAAPEANAPAENAPAASEANAPAAENKPAETTNAAPAENAPAAENKPAEPAAGK